MLTEEVRIIAAYIVYGGIFISLLPILVMVTCEFSSNVGCWFSGV